LLSQEREASLDLCVSLSIWCFTCYCIIYC